MLQLWRSMRMQQIKVIIPILASLRMWVSRDGLFSLRKASKVIQSPTIHLLGSCTTFALHLLDSCIELYSSIELQTNALTAYLLQIALRTPHCVAFNFRYFSNSDSQCMCYVLFQVFNPGALQWIVLCAFFAMHLWKMIVGYAMAIRINLSCHPSQPRSRLRSCSHNFSKLYSCLVYFFRYNWQYFEIGQLDCYNCLV